MSVYTRQYTQGVGWENKPSVATPINATNLNQMDGAIQDVDEEAADAFAVLESLINNIKGSRYFSDSVTSVSSSHLNTSRNFESTFKEGDVLFLYVGVDAESTGSVWSIYLGGTSNAGNIADFRVGNTPVSYTESIQAGTTLILTREAAPWTVWNLRAVISASGGGGGRVFSDHITEIDGTYNNCLRTSTDIYASDDPAIGDLVFLYSEVQWTFEPMGLTWSIMFGESSSSHSSTNLLDFRDASASGANFTDEMTVGLIIIISPITGGANTAWGVHAVISANGGGGSSTLAGLTDTNIQQPSNAQILMYDGTSGKWINAAGGSYSSRIFACKVTSITAGTGILAPSNFDFLDAASAPIAGDRIIVDIEASGTVPTGVVTAWQLQYEVNNTTVTKSISDGRDGNAYDPNFDDALTAGTTLLLYVGAGGSLACVAVITEGGGGSSTLAGLTDTNISSPADGQTLVYDSTSGKWVNETTGTVTVLVKATPNMTSNTTPSGVVSASSYYSSNYLPYYAFCGVAGNDTQTWATSGGDTTGAWIQYQFGAGVVIKKIATTNRNEGNPRVIRTFKFQGSNDGSTFTDLASCEITSNAGHWRQEFSINNNTAYTYYRLYVTEPWIPNDMTVGLAQLELYKEVEVGPAHSLDDLVDVEITTPTDAQPLTYDGTNNVWVNGGVIPAANGGTGNTDGYIRSGHRDNTVIGNKATIEGTNNAGTGSFCHVEGEANSATNTNTHAEGYSNTASGLTSHVEGASNTASNTNAHAEGNANTASGPNSHVQNSNNTASSDNASAAGTYNNAGYQNQFVVGKYNNNKATSLFEVGNGTATNARSNALELDGSGNLTVAGTITDGSGNKLGGTYFDQTVTLSTSGTTTITYTNAAFTTSSIIDIGVSEWGIVPDSVSVTTGSCTVIMPQVDSARTVTVRVYVK